MLETIKVGSEGNIVKVAQYLLDYAERKEADGIFDEKFAAEVGEWQSDHRLDVDYIIGKNTWAAIAKSLPTCSTSKNRKSGYTCALQILLGGLTVDGVYGTNTKKAVAAFQTACGLKADGICGQKTWNALIVGEAVVPAPTPIPEPTNPDGEGQTISGDKVLNNCVKYLQWDSKWKNVKYSTHTSSQTIGNSGCGTTSMAMILATWYDASITPVETSKMAVDNGYRTYDSGTAWGFFKWIFNKYNCFEKYVESTSITALESAIRDGALAVCSMNSNDGNFWTKGGWPVKNGLLMW